MKNICSPSSKKGKITKMKKKAPEAIYTYNTQIIIIQHFNFLLIKALHRYVRLI
jgi:hypothetical protein